MSAWIETVFSRRDSTLFSGRTLMSAWIETSKDRRRANVWYVALS